MIAIIGGTGIYDPRIFKKVENIKLETPYGPTPEISVGKFKGDKIFFLPRHGKHHELPPHKVNYKANIYGLKMLGVERIIATNSVGGINKTLKPGDVVIPHDLIDFTKSREQTFYDEEVVHIDLSRPYCPEIMKALADAANVYPRVYTNAVYACTEGPRFETPAEIRMLSKLGCDLVGMTGYPEVVLAREQEICYAALCTVTNYAAGISEDKLTATEVIEVVKENEEKLKNIIIKAIEILPKERECRCARALEGAKVNAK